MITHGFLVADYDVLLAFASANFPSDEDSPESFSIPARFATHPKKADRAMKPGPVDEDGNPTGPVRDETDNSCIIGFTLFEDGAGLVDMFEQVGTVHLMATKQEMHALYPQFPFISHYPAQAHTEQNT